MGSEIAKRTPEDQHGAIEVRQQVNQIQYLMREVLRDGEHFGTIKGCGSKPTLLQSGAEKIAYMFHFVPTYEVHRENLGNGHREYEVRCTLTSRDAGQTMGCGMGICSTMESKYRYRWEGYGDSRNRVENPDVADVWNTVLKMAKKRAFVDAVKSTTAASDIFTQDIEDLGAVYYEDDNAANRQQAPQPQNTPQEDPRKALWVESAALKAQAIAAGVKDSGIASWMATNITNPDGSAKPMKSYTVEDITNLIDFLKCRIRDMEELHKPEPIYDEPEYEQPTLESEDIPF